LAFCTRCVLRSGCSSLRTLLPSFPTRRSSDLAAYESRRLCGLPRIPVGGRRAGFGRVACRLALGVTGVPAIGRRSAPTRQVLYRDRKSTRLNSSHVKISYAVFGWKKNRDATTD